MEKTLLRIIQIFLGIIVLAVVVQVIFGSSVSFLPGDVVARITDMIGSLSIAGFVLIFIVLFFVIYLNNRVKKKNTLEEVKSNLRKIDEITKNGIVINFADEKEQYSVKKCPYCQEEINKDAIKCKHCGEGVGKGFEIIADGTYVANKIQSEKSLLQNEISINQGTPTKEYNIFFRVVWITVVVICIWTIIQLGSCAAIINSLG